MFTPQQIDLAAAAIANERIMRRGSPPIANILEMLPESLKTEVREDAEGALKAVFPQGAPESPDAIEALVRVVEHLTRQLETVQETFPELQLRESIETGHVAVAKHKKRVSMTWEEALLDADKDGLMTESMRKEWMPDAKAD
jgi:hypothetical protein